MEAWRKKVAQGDVIVVRYADDFVVGFQYRAEAERFWAELQERLAKFGLELHAGKTRLIEFGRFAAQNRKQRGKGKPQTFTSLGFTHYCGTRKSNGRFIVWRKTAKKRMVAKLHQLKAVLRCWMHAPTAQVGGWLKKVVLGYYRYHAVPGNSDRLALFQHRLRVLWRNILFRRSQKGRKARSAVSIVDPEQAPFGVKTMEERLFESVGSERFWMQLLGIFAGLALFLAAVGLYGVVSYSVVQRTHEFGLRMALGAPNGKIRAQVIMRGCHRPNGEASEDSVVDAVPSIPL